MSLFPRVCTTTSGWGRRRNVPSRRTASTTTGTWNWDYGNGDMGNQGVHEVDVARWGLGVTLPTRVCTMGGPCHV